MTTLPFVIQASPDTRRPLEETLKLLAETLEALKAMLVLEGLYASDGTLGIDDGNISVHFSKNSKQIDIRDTSDDIPF